MKKEDENIFIEKNVVEEQEEDEYDEDSNDIIDLDEVIQNQASNRERNQGNVNKEDKGNIKLEELLKVGTLNDIDFNRVNKDELINYLLYNDQNPLKEVTSSKKIDHNSVNVSKSMRIMRNTRDINLKENDPEIKNNDFNVAYSKVVNNMMNNANSNGDHPEILKLLLAGDNNTEEIKKNLKGFNKENYLERVEKFLERKNRNLEMINEKLHEEFNKKYTFNPTSNNGAKRKFEQFLEDQKAYKARLSEKLMQLKEECTKKDLDEMTSFKIDGKSKKIIEEKMKDINEPAYLRLFNKTKETKRTERVRSKSGNKDTGGRLKSEEKMRKSSSKPSLMKSSTVNIDEKINYLYNDAKKRQEKNEEIRKQQETVLTQNLEKERKAKQNENSKKFIMKKFIKQFQREMEELEKEIFAEKKENQENNESNQSQERPIKKINFLQFNNLMNRLKFVTIPKEPSNFQKEKIEVSTNQNEKKLLNDIHEELKDNEGYMNVDDVFSFLLAVLNLYEIYLLKVNKYDAKQSKIIDENKTVDPELKETKDKKPNDKENAEEIKKKKKEEERTRILSNIISELNNKIKVTKKYGGMDENSNYIINPEKSYLIHKDNSLLCINWNANDFKEKVTEKKEKVISQVHVPSFKPKINKKSEEMGIAYRKKLQSDPLVINENSIQDKAGGKSQAIEEGFIKNSGQEPNSQNYFDLLLIKKKKQENLLALKKEELEKNQLKDCTFKPKINSNYIVDYSKNPENKEKNKKRIEVLYKKGIADAMNKKDKTSEEYETEKYQRECTFKPNLEKDKITSVSSQNLYNKDMEKFAERLKQGRMDREIRDSVHQRGQLKKLDKAKSKEKNRLRDSANLGNLINQNKNTIPDLENEIKPNHTSEKDKTDLKIEGFSEESIKLGEKDAIPLLIIDVSIRPGEKKKIYVYEGDTPESLTEKFAKDNGVEGDVKIKLKNLIQKNMSRLLLKIEEETQSINSAKSFSTNK